jgi:hypothetical protein
MKRFILTLLIALVAFAATPLKADTGPIDDVGIHYVMVIDLDQPQVDAFNVLSINYERPNYFEPSLTSLNAKTLLYTDSGGANDVIGSSILEPDLLKVEFCQYYKHVGLTRVHLTDNSPIKLLKVPWRMSLI